MLGFRCLALSFVLLAASTTRAESPTPLSLLEGMSRAGQALNYQGSFTYEHSASMESFRILHWVDNGQSHEYLEYLNGPDTAMQRLRRVDGCLPVGLRLLQNQTDSTDLEGVKTGRIEDHYQLRLRDSERIAGRTARVLEVRPRDELRYGYLFGIDEESGLLLKSVLIDEEQRVLERFQFVHLDLNPPLEELRKKAADWPVSAQEGGGCDGPQSSEPSSWSLNWLPPGFAYSGERQLADNIEMLMYTDGLASFSIFLQPVTDEPRIEGWAKRGATSAYMGQLTVGNERESTSYRVTVVGEIPGKVAEQLARGISTATTPHRLEP